jgi:hypothetical protein
MPKLGTAYSTGSRCCNAGVKFTQAKAEADLVKLKEL